MRAVPVGINAALDPSALIFLLECETHHQLNPNTVED